MVRVVASIVFCALFTGIAYAADSPEQRPCKADMEKYCADARGDRAKMGDCMKAHFNDFSAACQAKIKERQQMHQGNSDAMPPHTGNSGAMPHPSGSTTQSPPQT